MTYGELKKHIKYIFSGDTRLADDTEALALFYKTAVHAIISDTEPLKLVTSDTERYTPYRWLDDVYFIRQPEYPSADTDELDMDERLIDAVISLMSSYMIRNANDMQRKTMYEAQAVTAISQYRWYIYEYLQNTGFYDRGYKSGTYIPNRRSTIDKDRQDIPVTLDWMGLLKYYRVFKDVEEWRYDWYQGAIDALDMFMYDFDGSRLSPSLRALWEQLCAYEDTDSLTDPERKALIELDHILINQSGGQYE